MSKKKTKRKSKQQFNVKRPSRGPQGKVKDLHNLTQFQQTVEQSDTPSIIDFWAEWCVPCKMTAPAFAAAAERYGDQVNFCKVNTEKNRSVAERFRIRSIPTMILMDGEEIVDIHVGAANQAAIERMAQKLVKRSQKNRPAEGEASAATPTEAPGLLGKLKGMFGGSREAAEGAAPQG